MAALDPPRGVAGLNGVGIPHSAAFSQVSTDLSGALSWGYWVGRQHCWDLAYKTNRVRQISLLEVGLCGNFSRAWGRTSPVKT